MDNCVYNPELPVECYQHAEKRLGETETVRNVSLQEIYLWLDENPHINADRSVKNILHFLRGTKYDIDKAKTKMERYYQMRADRIEWFKDRDPFRPEIVELLDLGVFLPLRIKDNENRQVIVIRATAHDPKIHSQNNVFKVGKMVLDLLLHQDESISVYGLLAVFDMKNVKAGHAMALPPTLIKRSVESWQCYPTLTKKLEFVNAPFYINAVLNTFRFFMNAKMKSRVTVNGGKSTACVDMPIELGGSGDSFTVLAKYWKEQCQENVKFFAEQEQYQTLLA